MWETPKELLVPLAGGPRCPCTSRPISSLVPSGNLDSAPGYESVARAAGLRFLVLPYYDRSQQPVRFVALRGDGGASGGLRIVTPSLCESFLLCMGR